jgi:uncharacterized protein (DUF58 family)
MGHVGAIFIKPGLSAGFSIVGMLIMSLMQTYRMIDGVVITAGDFPPVFVSERAGCVFDLYNPTRDTKQAIELCMHDGEQMQTTLVESLPHEAHQKMTLGFAPAVRGLNTLPRVSLRTFAPMGFFVAWSYFNPDKQVLAFPRPMFTPLPLSLDDQGEDHGVHEVPGREDVVGVRDYQAGDPMNLLSWKHVVQRDLLIAKLTTQATGGKTISFSWEQTTYLDVESKLSQLCGWIITAHQNADAFGLVLPGQTIPVDSGSAHLRRCLEALARY